MNNTSPEYHKIGILKRGHKMNIICASCNRHKIGVIMSFKRSKIGLRM